jgi:Domain of unknown function (DUF5916)/Carbohydrate family 9 binding domain-like
MKYCFFVLFTLFLTNLIAQNSPGTELPIRKAKGEIKIDGVLDEADWQAAFVAKDFKLNFPVDTALAPFQTEARMMFNDHYIYVSFVCYDDDKPYIVQSLKRDFDFDNNDNVTIEIGPYNDKQNGFFFVVTPYSVQMEGTVSTGGANDGSYSASWDNKWYSKSTRHADKWVAEIAIPFKSIRYKSGEWNINFLRWDRKHNNASSWVAVPIQYNLGALAYSGQLVWEDPAPKPSMNISIIPYLAGGLSQDTTVNANPSGRGSDFQFGGDAKIAVTPGMNLDLTFNPDFSQVDVDQQVVNLTRFEFQFPERRQFFLENSDLVANAGFPPTRLFFSRRIGIATDTAGDLRRIPIAYGARLSGSINKKWRLNAMNMQTKEKLEYGLPRQNYTAATVMRNFGHQSSIAITYVDKESLGLKSIKDSVKYFHDNVFRRRPRSNGDTVPYFNAYSRALSVDLELLSKDNKWYSGSYYSLSQNPFVSGQNHSAGIFGRFNDRTRDINLGGYFLGKNFNSETGFVPSHGVYPGLWSTFASINFKSYPKKLGIAVMGPQSNFNVSGTPDGTLTDQNYTIGYSVNLKNSISFELNWVYNYSRLTSTFNPVDRDGDKDYLTFKEGETYDWHVLNARFNSNQRSIVSFNAEANYGGLFNGTAFTLRGQLNYRYQPYGSLALRFDYNDVHLASGYGQEKLFVVGPRVDLTFTNNLFFTTFIQYNNVADNVGLNTRLQWRYKPASDFFIVYTENYLPENLASKNRALVFKFTYWLNI